MALLKSPPYRTRLDASGLLPYRIELLEPCGFSLSWTDDHLAEQFRTGVIGRVVAASERAGTPWLQTLLTWRVRRRSDVVLAMFESEAHALGLVRSLWPWGRRPPLVVMTCWLADLMVRSGPRRRALYRIVYRGVDHVVVFSENQRQTLERELGLSPDDITVVRFGVDMDELVALQPEEAGTVVAAGRDLGRDWACLAAAARGSGWDVQLVTRPQQVDGLGLPVEITVRGYLARSDYLDVLRTASVVVLPSEVREYPTGQTVLLEAMALGKACVVTDTPAMREYAQHDVTALLVPPHDPVALATAVDRVLGDADLRGRLGSAARDEVVARGGVEAMWRGVGAVLARVIDEGPGR